MKKIILSITIMLLCISVLITTSNAAFTMSMKSDSNTIKIGETATLTISANEKVVASNFDIIYDSTAFKLEESSTSNLSVAEKDGKIACIYADISGKGITEFKIKFKALKESTTGATFKIENAKFRAEGQDESYTGEQISGLNTGVTVKVATSAEKGKINQSTGKEGTATSKSNLPKTGKETGFVIAGMVILAILAIIFWKKSKELSKIFSSLSVFVIALVLVTSLNENVYAATDVTSQVKETPKPIQYGGGTLSSGESFMGILLDKSDSNRKVKKMQLTENETILDILNEKKENILDTDLVKTGYYIKQEAKEHRVVLYGDANGDGIICDTDDLMIIINDYLGIKPAGELNKLAANLYDNDNVLDSDDLMQMINMYLGKLDNSIVKSAETKDDKTYLDNNWKYSTISNHTIVLEKYVGKDTEINIKETYTMDGTQYIARLAESKIEDYKPESVGWICSGPFATNTNIEKVIFESTDIIGNNASYLFYHCTNLKQVIGFGGKFTDMTSCFEGCTSLLNENGEINIPDTVTKLHMAFMNCTSMKILPSISENSKLENGYMAFKGCSSAHSGTIYLNSSVNNIASMFSECKMLGYYSGTGFRIYSSVDTDKLNAGNAFDNCGYESYVGAYGSQERLLLIKNSNSSEADKAYKFFCEEVENAENCSLKVKDGK